MATTNISGLRFVPEPGKCGRSSNLIEGRGIPEYGHLGLVSRGGGFQGIRS